MELADRVAARSVKIATAHRQIRRINTMINGKDGRRAEPDPDLDQALADSMRDSTTALDRATAGQRSAFLARYEERLEQLARIQKSDREKSRSLMPAGPRYKELLKILGQWPPDDDPEEIKKAENALNQQLRRILLELRRLLGDGHE